MERTFEITTKTKHGTYIFYTYGNYGKEALRNLLNESSDFNDIMGNIESNNIIIELNHIKKRK